MYDLRTLTSKLHCATLTAEPLEKYILGRMAAFNILGLPIKHAHAFRIFSLPAYHWDPVERILIAQAKIEKMAILTADGVFEMSKVKVIPAA